MTNTFSEQPVTAEQQQGRREKKKALTRQSIVNAASKLFSLRGFDATSIDEICQAADVVKGTFYYHFKSKEDLVVDLRKEMTSQLEEFATRELAAGKDALQVLRELMQKDARWTEENIELAVIFVSQIYVNRAASLKNPDTPPSKLRGSLRRPMFLAIEAAQQSGQLRADVESSDLCEMIVGFYIHAKRTWLNARKPGTLEPMVMHWLDILLSGLRAK